MENHSFVVQARERIQVQAQESQERGTNKLDQHVFVVGVEAEAVGQEMCSPT